MHQRNHQSRRALLKQLVQTGLAFTIIPVLAKAADPLKNKQMKPESLAPFYIPPHEPVVPGPGGMDIRTIIKSAQTGNQFSCVEYALAPKKMGPAPHYHKELDELMYVLDGTVSVMVEDVVYEIPAGGWHMRPRGLVHTFFNNTDKPFRAIDMYFNQNFEDYLEEMFHQIIPQMREQHLSPQDPAIANRMHALHEKFGMVGFPEKRQAIIDRYGLKA